MNIDDVIKKAQLEMAKNKEILTVEQLEKVVIEAIKCGDFSIHLMSGKKSFYSGVLTITHGQNISYIPYRMLYEAQSENESYFKFLEARGLLEDFYEWKTIMSEA